MALDARNRAHIVLDGEPYTLFSSARTPSGYDAEFGPSETTGQSPKPDVPVTQEDWSGGAGYPRDMGAGGYWYTLGGWTHERGLIMPAGKVTEMTMPGGLTFGAVTSSFFAGDHLYVIAGRYALKIADGTGHPSTAADFGSVVAANIGLGATEFTHTGSVPRYWWVGQESDVPWYYDLVADTWGRATGCGTRYWLAKVFWVIHDGNDYLGSWRLIGTDTNNSFKHVSADPGTDANWSSSISVGTPGYPIVSLAATKRKIVFAKRNGIHSVISQGGVFDTPNLTPYWEHSYSDDNGAVTWVYEGRVYSSHARGLDSVSIEQDIRQDDPEFRHPFHGLPNGSEIGGRVTAMCEDSGWLMVAMYNGTDSFVMRGKERSKLGVPGITSMVWYGAEAVFRDERITHMVASTPSSNPRLWIFTIDSSDVVHAYWMALPKSGSAYRDYKAGGPMQFQGTYSVYFSASTFGDTTAKKIIRRHEVLSEGLSAGISLNVYANADGGGWNLQGTVQESPRAALNPNTLTLEQGYNIGTRIDGTGSVDQPSIIRGMKTRASVINDQDEYRTYPILLADRSSLPGGAMDPRDSASKWRALKALQGAGPVTLRDETGTEYEVQVEPGIRRKTIQDPPNQGWVTVANVTVSVRRQTSGVSQYDAGAIYDGGFIYGE